MGTGTATRRPRRADPDADPLVPADLVVPDVPPVLVARRAEVRRIEAERAALKARWNALPGAERARIAEAVERANPAVVRFPAVVESLCHEMMRSEFPISSG